MFMSTLTRWLGASAFSANNFRANAAYADSFLVDDLEQSNLEPSSFSNLTPPASKPSKAIVDATIAPGHTGRVRYQGSWWSARCDRDITLSPGEAVQVIGRQNITLLVEPLAIALSK